MQNWSTRMIKLDVSPTEKGGYPAVQVIRYDMFVDIST
jgi:hypothetical protein